MPRIEGIVNRQAVSAYKGKLHSRSSGLLGSGKNEAGKRRQAPKPKRAGLPARNGKVNDIVPALAGLTMPIEGLKIDPDNARLHPERNLEAIKASLAQYGQRKPIVVRAQTMTVVAGNGTLEAAKALGWTRIAASVQPMTEVEAAGYGLADNRTAELARWDFEVVARLDKLLRESGESDPVGWSVEELSALRLGDVPNSSHDYQLSKEEVLECPECGHIFPKTIQKITRLENPSGLKRC
jgi:hypothetical protein